MERTDVRCCEESASRQSKIEFALPCGLILGMDDRPSEFSQFDYAAGLNTKDEKFEDVVKSAQQAAVLVLVY
jgi:hypothetical protein